MKRRSRGFSLMELLVTLMLAGVLLGIGVPSFREFMRNGRLTGAANEMLLTVVTARNEAVRRQTVVSVCPSTTPTDPGATCGGLTTKEGYIAFLDTNSNCVRDGAELGDPENVVANFVTHTEITSARNGTCISFAANGFRRIVGGQPTTQHTLFCDTRGNTKTFPTSTFSYARGLEVLPTGRASVSRIWTELDSWGSTGTTVVCP